MTDPQPLRRGVERLMRHLEAPTADTVSVVFEHWAEVVGPAIAEHGRPVSIDGATLVIAVDDPAWASHLQWSQDEVLTRLGHHVGALEIEAIRVVVRGGR